MANGTKNITTKCQKRKDNNALTNNSSLAKNALMIEGTAIKKISPDTAAAHAKTNDWTA